MSGIFDNLFRMAQEQQNQGIMANMSKGEN